MEMVVAVAGGCNSIKVVMVVAADGVGKGWGGGGDGTVISNGFGACGHKAR